MTCEIIELGLTHRIGDDLEKVMRLAVGRNSRGLLSNWSVRDIYIIVAIGFKSFPCLLSHHGNDYSDIQRDIRKFFTPVNDIF